MGKLAKTVWIFLVIVSMCVSFTGCSGDDTAFLNSVIKTASIQSAKEQTTMSIKLDTNSPFIANDPELRKVYNFINCLTLTANQTYIQDKAKNAISANTDCTIATDDMSFKVTVWVDAAKDKLVEIFKIPSIAKLALPQEYENAQYMVMDINAMAGLDSAGMNMDYLKDMIPASFEMQDKYMAFLQNYVKATAIHTPVIKRTKQTAQGTAYELNLSDKGLKDLIRLAANDFAVNPQTREAVKTFALDIAGYYEKLSPTVAQYNIKSQIESAFAYLELNPSDNITIVNAFADKLDGVKLLGDQGIKMTFIVNSSGYIVDSDTTIDISLDLAAGQRLFAGTGSDDQGNSAASESTHFNAVVKYHTVLSDINKIKSVDMPVLTEENSINYIDLIQQDQDKYDDPGLIVEEEEAPVPEGEIQVRLPWGGRIEFENKPVMSDDTLYVPLHEFVAALYGESWWNDDEKQLYVRSYGTLMHYTPNDDKIYTDSIIYLLSRPTKTFDGADYVPLRSFARIFDLSVVWAEEKSTAYLSY